MTAPVAESSSHDVDATPLGWFDNTMDSTTVAVGVKWLALDKPRLGCGRPAQPLDLKSAHRCDLLLRCRARLSRFVAIAVNMNRVYRDAGRITTDMLTPVPASSSFTRTGTVSISFPYATQHSVLELAELDFRVSK